jgi:hypothetical protein
MVHRAVSCETQHPLFRTNLRLHISCCAIESGARKFLRSSWRVAGTQHCVGHTCFKRFSTTTRKSFAVASDCSFWRRAARVCGVIRAYINCIMLPFSLSALELYTELEKRKKQIRLFVTLKWSRRNPAFFYCLCKLLTMVRNSVRR